MALLDTGEGAPWGAKKYGVPGDLKLAKDASQFQGFTDSPVYGQLLDSMASNRKATAYQGQGADPFAASRGASEGVVRGRAEHASMSDRQRAMALENNRILQEYLDQLERDKQEEAERFEFLDKSGRIHHGAGSALISAYSGGAFAGKGAATKGQPGSYSNPRKRSEYGPFRDEDFVMEG